MTVAAIVKPDMSFTQDPQWQTRREALWQQYCENQFDDVRKKELKVYRNFFFTGELESPQDHGRGGSGLLRASIDRFPLRTPEGWNYVICTFGGFDRSKTEMTKLMVFHVLASLTNHGWTLEEELALWDHFLPKSYQKIVKSPVATKHKGVIEGELPSSRVISKFCGGISCLFDGLEDVSPKYVYRPVFLLSALQVIAKKNIRTEKKLERQIIRLMGYCFTDQSNVLPENKEPLNNYLAEFRQGMETLQLDPIIKAMWEDVKRENS